MYSHMYAKIKIWLMCSDFPSTLYHVFTSITCYIKNPDVTGMPYSILYSTNIKLVTGAVIDVSVQTLYWTKFGALSVSS